MGYSCRRFFADYKLGRKREKDTGKEEAGVVCVITKAVNWLGLCKVLLKMEPASIHEADKNKDYKALPHLKSLDLMLCHQVRR